MAAMLTGGTTVLLRETADGPETLLILRPDRGSFAGAWVFPGGVVEDDDVVAGEGEQQMALRAAARECEEEVGIRPVDLRPLSCWIPPLEAPKRVRTWFFAGRPPARDLCLAPDEVVDAQWISPTRALRLHADGELILFPPTWVTLTGLTAVATAQAVLDSASDPEVYSTHIVGGGVFAWGGDAEHPDGGDGRHRLDTSILPWQYVRD